MNLEIHYDSLLILLSIIIACAASYTSLEKSHLKNKLWLIAGLWALAFGPAFYRYDGFSYRNDYAI